MSESLGAKIKAIRKQNKLTQKQLSEGICTQALISMFESNETIPSSLVLYKIAQKLNVSLDYFFSDVRPSNKVNAQDNETFMMIRSLIQTSQYYAAEKIVLEELKNDEYQGMELAFLKWHEGLCRWELERDEDFSIEHLNYAIELAENDLELIASIMNSKAIIYTDLERFDEAISIYESALLYFEKKLINNSLLHRKLLLGLSRTYSYASYIEEALSVAEAGIKLNIHEESLYLLGEFLFQKGRMLSKLERKIEAKQLFLQAKSLFEVLDKNEHIDICNIHLAAIEESIFV